jgi:glycosyltransferase involved in cell wall biosynthesis
MIVGNGPVEEEVRALAAGDERIHFLPFQPQSSMPDVYATADITVLPSDSESWGLCVNESFCMSVPAIVSSHVGCARDLVLPEKTGLIFRAGDADDLTSALLRATESPERIREWGDAARTRIEAYSYERATEGLLTALQ